MTTAMPYWFDGNNLIGQTAAQTRADRQARLAFLERLSEYSAAHGGRFVVFFDGDDPDRFMPPRRVQVRFSAPLSTDDRILQTLAGMRNPREVIVVTNDNALRGRCRDAGARTMGWGEFETIKSKRQGSPRGRTQREETVKVDEWARYFGFDKESLDE